VLAVLCRPGGRGQVRRPPPAPMWCNTGLQWGGHPSRARAHKPAAVIAEAWGARARAWLADVVLARTAACEGWCHALACTPGGGRHGARAGGLTRAGAQALCASAGLLHVLLAALGAAGPGARSAPPLLTKWLCLCLGRLCQDMPQARPPGPMPPREGLTCGVSLCVGALRLHYCSSSVWAVLQRSCSAAAPRRDCCALPCLCGLQVLAPAFCCPAGKKACQQLTTDAVADVDMRFLSFAVASECACGGSQPCQGAMPMRAECAGVADDDRCCGGRGGRVAVRAADVGALGGPRGGRVCARQLHPGAPLCSCHPNCAAPGLGPCTGFPVFHTGCLPVML